MPTGNRKDRLPGSVEEDLQGLGGWEEGGVEKSRWHRNGVEGSPYNSRAGSQYSRVGGRGSCQKMRPWS